MDRTIMDRVDGSASLMIVSDLDFTMVDHLDLENFSLLRFNALWEAYYRPNSLLVFSTGRSSTIYKQLKNEKPLLTPDITITSVGTEIMYGESMVIDYEWEQYLNHGWNREIVIEETKKFHELNPQAETEQQPHKLSFFVDKIKALEVKVALLEILQKRGVSNAWEELLQWHAENTVNNPNIIHATERCAAGIMQALGSFRLGPNVSPRDIRKFKNCEIENTSPGHEVVKFYLFYESWRRSQVEKSDKYFRMALFPSGTFVHPSGVKQPVKYCIDTMMRLYGDKQGKQYRVWVDLVSSAQIGSETWLVKFYKWELSGEERHGCLTTVLLSSKARVPDGFTWMHMEQKWLDGSAPEDQSTWLF